MESRPLMSEAVHWGRSHFTGVLMEGITQAISYKPPSPERWG